MDPICCVIDLAEEFDAHRKRQQQKYPDLTLTDMYNVLQKLRALDRNAGVSPAPGSDDGGRDARVTIHSAAFSPKEKQIHDHGLVSILKQLHADLDAAVFGAYGWPTTLTDDQLLQNLVTLNHQRAAEEQRGHIRYLRPDFQCPTSRAL